MLKFDVLASRFQRTPSTRRPSAVSTSIGRQTPPAL